MSAILRTIFPLSTTPTWNKITTHGSKRGKRVSKRLEGLGDVAPIVIGGSRKTLKTAFPVLAAAVFYKTYW